MTSKEYLKSYLTLLTDKFPNIKVRYEQSTHDFVHHIIEVLPLNLFQSDSYMLAEIDLEDDFDKLYPSESLVFISEGSLCEIRKCEFKIGY